jgi:hypothetical protein
MNWYEHTIKPRLATLSLEDMQDLFFIQTLSPYWLSARLVKLCQISYRESELLRSFNSRFSSAAVNGKFDVHSTADSSAWLRSLYLALLPLCVRTKIPVDQITSASSLLELMTRVAHYHPEPAPNFTWAHPTCQRRVNCPGVLSCSHCSGPASVKTVTRNPAPAVATIPSDPPFKSPRLSHSDQQSRPPGIGWVWCNSHAAWGRHADADCSRRVNIPSDLKVRTIKLAQGSDHLYSLKFPLVIPRLEHLIKLL